MKVRVQEIETLMANGRDRKCVYFTSFVEHVEWCNVDVIDDMICLKCVVFDYAMFLGEKFGNSRIVSNGNLMEIFEFFGSKWRFSKIF